MSVPTIIPSTWAPNVSFTVSQSSRLIAEIHLSGLDATNGDIEVTVPAGATIDLVRDPTSWTAAGTNILNAGVWSATPVTLGNWTVSSVPGTPRVVSVANPSGTSPQGLLRLLFSGLGGSQVVLNPGGGTVSIDRLLTDPLISNVVVDTGTPVRELDTVQLKATLQAGSRVNPAALFPASIAAIPPIQGEWTPRATNAVAVKAFSSTGATASFRAPAVYAPLALDFDLKAGLDLASNGTIDATDPSNSGSINVPITTVKHRMMLVLDRSGSMFGPKWDSTIAAAHAWVDLFRSLRPSGNHKVGIVTFEHDPCSWSATPTNDIALCNPANGSIASGLSDLAGFADATTINLGTVQTCTPIGDALVESLQIIEDGDISGTKGTVVLMTDGYENAGLTTLGPAPPPGVQTLKSRLDSWPGQAKNLVGDRVFTLAIGQSVDEDRLNGLPALFGQTKAKGYFRLTNDVKEILPAFASMLGEVLDAEQVLPVLLSDPDAPGNSLYFQVPKGEQRLVFLVPWSNFQDSILLARRPTGTNQSFVAESGVDFKGRGTHGIVTVNLAEVTQDATDWRLQHKSAATSTTVPLTNADVVAVRDLRTQTEITLDQHEYFIGDEIRLTCAIRSGGAPVTGATVLVDIARPGEGLGTFLATNSGKVRPDGEGGFEGGKPTQVGDPDHGKGLLFKTLLQATGQEALPVLEQADLRLFDDGAHGDGAAGNGDYSNVFTDTLKEGTYTFRFRITGQLPDGSRFSRLFVRSTWAGVRPDIQASVVIWQIGSIVGGLQQATLTITPKSASGEFLGPFRDHAIGFTVWNASLTGPLVGNLDGSYVQTIEYQPGATPVVVPVIYGDPLGPTGPTIDQAKPGCLGALLAWLKLPLSWAVLVVLLILLVLVLL